VGRRLPRTKFLPLFCSGVGGKAGITFGRLMRLSRCSFPEKKNTAHAVQAKDFVGVKRRQNDRVVAGRYVLSGQYPLKVVVITVRTTTFVSRIWNKGYHGSVGTSIWFCKIYYDKAEEVRLMLLICS